MTKADIKNIKNYIATEKSVEFRGHNYIITAIILRYNRKAKDGDYWDYSLELMDSVCKHSVVIAGLPEVHVL